MGISNHSMLSLRDELLNGEIFSTLTEVKIFIEEWHREYNQVRLYSASGYRSPAPEATVPVIIPMGLT